MEESNPAAGLRARPAQRGDAAAVTEIYNQGIEDRIATFETEPRSVADVLPWFDHAHGFVVVTDAANEVAGYGSHIPIRIAAAIAVSVSSQSMSGALTEGAAWGRSPWQR